jgi:DNA-binding SARP family transcriptional activator
VRFGVLGPLVAEDARGPVDLKGPRHRAVLARLLIAHGQVVPVDRLVDDLWADPPDGAVGAIQTFVGALRRALEPGRVPRSPAQVLVTIPPGYALRADSVDADRFESMVEASRSLLAQNQAATALSEVDGALALWRGPAYAEFSGQAWARSEISRLDSLRLLAVERRAEALLALGRAAEAVPAQEAQVSGHPLRENGWRLLALALYRAGRQGEALGALRRAREVLVTELGVDPGPSLRQTESDILAQAPQLTVSSGLVGRSDELAQLAEAAAARGRLRLVLVSGDAGAGKTALVESFSAGLGWTTAWGTSPDHAGVPALWPWTQILADGPAPSAAATRFEWHRAVGSHLASMARRSPLLVVLDDLHWAGEETLALLASVVLEPIAEPVLVIGTYRTTEISPALADFLGRVARVEPTRIYLGGLSPAAVAELVRATIGREVDARTIHQRSGGNPFYVRELARLLDGPGGLEAVPPGVRDVVRYRVAKLPESVQAVLRQAAVIGLDIDLSLLGDGVLDAIETATERGFLLERGPGRFQFAHALVRDTLYQDISLSRRAIAHAEIGSAIERVRPDDVSALAHHFLLAGSPRALGYARAAAEQAERVFAPHEAARLWAAALSVAGDADVRVRLDLIMGKARTLAVTGALSQARQDRSEAVTLASSLNDPVLTAQVIGAFTVPALWTDNDDPVLARQIVSVASHTLTSLPPNEKAHRSRLLSTLALELRNTGGPGAAAAALEAESIARSLGDPAALAFALNARFMQSFTRAGLAPERARIGTELVSLASAHSLVTFEVLGHLILMQAGSALADFAAADSHAAAADRLGLDYQLPLVGVFTRWYRALRLAVSGQPAEAAYRAAAAGLTGTGMSGLDDILAFALYCTKIPQEDFGVYTPWCRPADVIPDSPRDLLYEARTCLHAATAIDRADRPAMKRLYTNLKPAAAELAGAGSGLLTLGPVAHYLGDLATALGHPEQAAAHYAQALTVATKANAPHWIAALPVS